MQQLGFEKTVCIELNVHAGIAQVAIGGDQLRQKGDFLHGTRLTNGKANAARAGVDERQQLRDALQIGQRHIDA